MKNSSREQHPQINREQDGSGVDDPLSSFGFRTPGSPCPRAPQIQRIKSYALLETPQALLNPIIKLPANIYWEEEQSFSSLFFMHTLET